MLDLTLKRMDAAISRAYDAPVSICDPEGLNERDRWIILAGMQIAERICVDSRRNRQCPLPVIRAAIRQVKKEMKANG
jgi:hypothetical protein